MMGLSAQKLSTLVAFFYQASKAQILEFNAAGSSVQTRQDVEWDMGLARSPMTQIYHPVMVWQYCTEI